MLLNTDFYTPSTLTGYARTALLRLPINQTSLARFLPYQPLDDLVYRYTKGGDSLISAAPYRAYDAESSITKRPGLTRVSGELPPISRKIPLMEYDRLRQRSNPEASIQRSILSDTERLVRQIAMRLEVARASALVTGAVSIDENGVKASVDFGRDASMAVTASTLWSTTASADPLNDLRTWQQAYVDRNGQKPAVFQTSERVVGLLLQNAAIRSLVAGSGGTPTLVSLTKLAEILQAYGLPRIETYDVRYDVAGTATRVIDDHIGLLLPEPVDPNSPDETDLGGTFIGTTAESLDPSYAIEGDEAGIVAGVYRSEDPIAIWTKAAAIALPVLATPDLAMACTVATDI